MDKMKIRIPQKILISCLLILILISLSFYYEANYEKNLKYPPYGAISSNNSLGQVVSVDGSVVNIYPESYELIQTYHDQTLILTILGPSPAQLGDHVSLIGVLGPSNQIVEVKEIHVISDWKWKFELLRSFLAFVFMLVLFFYFWKFNFRELEFRRR